MLWQAGNVQQAEYMMYRQWLHTMALNRFKWLNLPASVDERFLEWVLFHNGMATIACDPATPSVPMGMQAVMQGSPNCYNNMSAWMALGANGIKVFNCTPQTGVVIYDNAYRNPIVSSLDIIAQRLSNLDRTMDVNLGAQRKPVLFCAPQTKVNDIVNLYRQVETGEPVVIGYDSLKDLVDKGVSSIDPKVPLIVPELTVVQTYIMNQAYRLMGIPTIDEKRECLISDEVNSQSNPSDLMALDPLTARRKACKEWNQLHPELEPIDVVWRSDNESDNYDYKNNLMIQNDGDKNA